MFPVRRGAKTPRRASTDQQPGPARYRSTSEAKTAADLEARGIPFGYESRKIEYVKPARRTSYTPDFELPNGMLVEVKGFWAPLDRQKIVLITRHNPDLDLRMLFDRPDTPINKGSSTTYAKFCDQNGIIWAKGPKVPEEWLT